MEQPEQLDYHIYRDYQVQQKIGKGTYGIVYKAINKKTNQIIAIKKIIDAFQNLIDAKRTYRELNYLLQLKHPCIVQLHQILLNPRKGQPHQASTTRLAHPQQELRGCNTDKSSQKPNTLQRHVYAIFQFVETDLKMVLKRCSQLQPIQRKFISYQLLQGIAYLHRSGLIHRDIKPQNLLINCNSLEVKICDFGMARLRQANSGSQGVLTQYVASRWYRPPEALLGISTCEPAIDLWSVGCVIAELALGTPLFQGKSTLDQLEVIFKCLGMPGEVYINKLSSVQAQYVLKSFTLSRKARFKPLNELLSMCSSQEVDIISKFLNFNPGQRMSADQVLNHPYFDEVRSLNSMLDTFSCAKSHISDISQTGYAPQSEERAQSNHNGIQRYRSLIQQLEKYAQKSTKNEKYAQKSTKNEKYAQKSTKNEKYAQKPTYSNLAVIKNTQSTSKASCLNNLKSDEGEYKSTKQSKIVTLNSQKLLSPVNKLSSKVIQGNYELHTKQGPSRNLKFELESKNLFLNHKLSKTRISEQPENKKIRDKTRKKITQKQSSSKNKLKQNTLIKPQSQNSAFLLDHTSLNKLNTYKKHNSTHLQGGKKLSQISLSKSRKTLGAEGSSMISNNSNISILNSKSKQKQKQKKLQMPTTHTKQELIKKLTKNCRNLKKTGVAKCRSNANVRSFNKRNVN